MLLCASINDQDPTTASKDFPRGIGRSDERIAGGRDNRRSVVRPTQITGRAVSSVCAPAGAIVCDQTISPPPVRCDHILNDILSSSGDRPSVGEHVRAVLAAVGRLVRLNIVDRCIVRSRSAERSVADLRPPSRSYKYRAAVFLAFPDISPVRIFILNESLPEYAKPTTTSKIDLLKF
jgi:hypothetical protein